jgi:hypothetical protein
MDNKEALVILMNEGELSPIDEIATAHIQLMIDEARRLSMIPLTQYEIDYIEVGYRLGREQGISEGWNKHLEAVKKSDRNNTRDNILIDAHIASVEASIVSNMGLLRLLKSYYSDRKIRKDSPK